MADNKNRIEQSLGSAITSIGDRLPGLKLFEQIYNGNDELDIALQDEIVSAYQCFMDFCIVAIKYYRKGGARKCYH